MFAVQLHSINYPLNKINSNGFPGRYGKIVATALLALALLAVYWVVSRRPLSDRKAEPINVGTKPNTIDMDDPSQILEEEDALSPNAGRDEDPLPEFKPPRTPPTRSRTPEPTPISPYSRPRPTNLKTGDSASPEDGSEDDVALPTPATPAYHAPIFFDQEGGSSAMWERTFSRVKLLTEAKAQRDVLQDNDSSSDDSGWGDC
jgi:hypothetical protein